MRNTKKIKAFTLAELLITLGILGVLAAILIPVLNKTKPGADKMMIRKCFYTTKDTTYRILADPNLSPDGLIAGDFKTNFKNNVKNAASFTANSTDHFMQTNDGVDWYKSSSAGYASILFFDVNGSNAAPNCTQYTSKPTNYTNCANDKTPDTFAVGVKDTGKLDIFPSNQTYMKNVLTEPKNIKRD